MIRGLTAATGPLKDELLVVDEGRTENASADAWSLLELELARITVFWEDCERSGASLDQSSAKCAGPADLGVTE